MSKRRRPEFEIPSKEQLQEELLECVHRARAIRGLLRLVSKDQPPPRLRRQHSTATAGKEGA
jgi:hypothetical protein